MEDCNKWDERLNVENRGRTSRRTLMMHSKDAEGSEENHE